MAYPQGSAANGGAGDPGMGPGPKGQAEGGYPQDPKGKGIEHDWPSGYDGREITQARADVMEKIYKGSAGCDRVLDYGMNLGEARDSGTGMPGQPGKGGAEGQNQWPENQRPISERVTTGEGNPYVTEWNRDSDFEKHVRDDYDVKPPEYRYS